MSAWCRSRGTRTEGAFHLPGGSPPRSRVRPTSGQHRPGWYPVAVSLAVALALPGSGEQVAEAPAETFVSKPRQEEPRPAALLGVSSPGEVFWGSHRWRELCPVREGGFALLALNLWKPELCRGCRAVRAELLQAQPVPLAALAVLCHEQGVPWAHGTINGKNCFYFLADLTSLKQLPVSV